MDLFAGCTAAQCEAIKHTEGPLLVIAAAGSGKTRVVTRRIAHLLAQGVRGDEILGITFTNKAAGEMAERVRALVGRAGVTLSTFHSLCARILRIYGERAGIVGRDFTIYDRDDRIRMIKRVQEEAGISGTNWPPGRMEEAISRAKREMLSAEAYGAKAESFYERRVHQVYALYEERMRRANALDFDDLLMDAVRMCEGSAEVLGALQDRYRYLLVDEYQDTNHTQYRLTKLLAGERHNVCVTGDPDQSIYGWRGARISNILDFEKDYPDARSIKLEQNWRSTKRILAIAAAVIERNEERKDRGLWTENEEGAEVEEVVTTDESAEAEEIARRVEELIGEGMPAQEIAVFYRTNALSRVMERGLQERGIPYEIVAGTEFYARREIKDVLGYVRLAVNGADDVGFRRVINTPARGIGKTTQEKIAALAGEWGAGLLDASRREAKEGKALGAGARGKLAGFAAVIDDITGTCERGVRATIEKAIERSGYRKFLRESKTEKDAERLANVEELVSAAAEFEGEDPTASVRDFLERVALVSDVDEFDPEAGKVSLMTLHSAKGLEFDCVFIAAMEEGMLPHVNASRTRREIEEERRLCYVGMTRARKRLVLSRAAMRLREGRAMRAIRSPFLDEVPGKLIATTDLSTQEEGDLSYVGVAGEEDEAFRVGERVRHPKYGVGEVVSTWGRGSRLHVEVSFGSVGLKRFVAQHAPLTKAGGGTDGEEGSRAW